jgi:hypothetical protein
VSLFFLVGHGGQAGVGEMGGSGVDGGPAAMEHIQLGVVGSSILVVNWRASHSGLCSTVMVMQRGRIRPDDSIRRPDPATQGVGHRSLVAT